MPRRLPCYLIFLVVLLSFPIWHEVYSSDKFVGLTQYEQNLISRVNGTEVYEYAVDLERIGLDHNLSGYSFRSSGSRGATESAKWIQQQMENLGLETKLEPFNFTAWDLPVEPVLLLDFDGNQSTLKDQVRVQSFQPEHFSWPTREGGAFAELAVLPIPSADSLESARIAHYDPQAWTALNTSGKVLIVGREIRWNRVNTLLFKTKLMTETPAAVIFTWTYSWISWVPPFFNSAGGKPLSSASLGSYFWNLKIPVGWISYEDGQWIKTAMNSSGSPISAMVQINATISDGTHYNVVGRFEGSSEPGKIVIVSAHYDSVVDAGFCDNAAGVAGMLELAKAFSEAARDNDYHPAYTLWFIAFGGEELGLVGSTEFIRQHLSEIGDVAAVINIDCIGNPTLQISEAFVDDDGINIQDIVTKSGLALGIEVNVTGAGGSDQETFRTPALAAEEVETFWHVDSGISNLSRIKSSIMISSYPIFYSDKWDNGTAGWIHTPYDNSSSTNALGWVNASTLEAQVQVTSLTVVRFIATSTSPLLTQIASLVLASVIAVATVLYFRGNQVRKLLNKLAHDVLIHITSKEIVYMIILACLYLFLSYAFFMRVGRTEIDLDGLPTGVDMMLYGKPFEMIGIIISGLSTRGESTETSFEFNAGYNGTTSVLWIGMTLNIIAYSILAFFTVYAFAKIRHFFEYRSMAKSCDLSDISSKAQRPS